MVFGLHEYHPIYTSEAFAVKAMRPILTREFPFQINTSPFSILEVLLPNTFIVAAAFRRNRVLPAS